LGETNAGGERYVWPVAGRLQSSEGRQPCRRSGALIRLNAEPGFLDLTNGLNNVFGQAGNLSAFHSATAALMVEAQALPDTLEVYAFAAARSVADSSASYWVSQATEWETLGYPDCVDDPTHPACSGPTQVFGWVQDWAKRTIGADIGGAAFAATYTWLAGAGAAVPIGATAGAASAAQLAMEAWSWLTQS
jgi:hypothetical protein